MRTVRQRHGALAEAEAARHLEGRGWQVVARNLRIGRDEIDLITIDPGPPAQLVLVEVRSATSSSFGRPEERLDRAKVGHLYRAAASLTRSGVARRLGVAGLAVRVDLVVIDRRHGGTRVRHLRRLEPT